MFLGSRARVLAPKFNQNFGEMTPFLGLISEKKIFRQKVDFFGIFIFEVMTDVVNTKNRKNPKNRKIKKKMDFSAKMAKKSQFSVILQMTTVDLSPSRAPELGQNSEINS